MNDHELDARLRSAPVPERAEEYWEDFPVRMRIRLQQRRQAVERAQARYFRLAWATACALAAGVALLNPAFQPLHAASVAVDQEQRHVEQQIQRFHAGLHVLVLNTGGMGYLFTEAY